MKNEKEKNDNIGFGKLVISIMRKRWLISSLEY